jgi:hypothetical protein
MIYMLFLAYEAARKAIDDLIEYEPTHVENTIVILLTEISAYHFLTKNCGTDLQARRLKLRASLYENLFSRLYKQILCQKAETETDKLEWKKAEELWNGLYSCAHRAGLEISRLESEQGAHTHQA